MQLLTDLDRVLIYVFLISSMLSVGMQTTASEIRALFATRTFLFRLLFVNFVVVPLAGLVAVKSLPIAPETGAAFLLLACTPGGISALQFTTKIKGAAVYAGSSAVILSLLAVLVSPFILSAAQTHVSFTVPYGRALLFILLSLLGPLVAGMWVRAKGEERAGKLAKLFVIVGTLAFVALLLLLARRRVEASAILGSAGVLAMFGLILFAMAAGWFMSGAGEWKPILAIVTSMRNAALCLLIAQHAFSGRGVQEALIAFSAMMVPPNLLLTIYALILARRRAKASDELKKTINHR